MFTVSCVTGENLNLVRKFLNLVPPARSPMDQEKLAQECTEYQVSICLLSTSRTYTGGIKLKLPQSLYTVQSASIDRSIKCFNLTVVI